MKWRIVWIPTEDEIRERSEAVRWMAELGFSDKLMDSVMYLDQPIISMVRQMVGRYGPADTQRRLNRFLFGDE